MDELRDLLDRAATYAVEYRASLADRQVGATVDGEALVDRFAGPLPDGPTPAGQVIDELVEAAEPGLVHTAGPRYFGFVIGGSLDVGVAADVVTAGWDQCAYNAVLSPAAGAAETVAGTWLKELLGLPAQASVGFVTGGQEANTVGLAAARHHLLTETGWNVARDGLAAAPRIRVVAGEERHATIDRALRLLGLGTGALEPVETDANGGLRLDALEEVLAAGDPDRPTVVCLQAGNVNTGACDPLRAACETAHGHGAWVHVDGAFGLWAAASPVTRPLVDGLELADSWACDGHKWLNVPYDAGYAICAHPRAHADAVSYSASYLVGSGGPVAGLSDFTLESSRRARGFATWAVLRHLGRSGVAAIVERSCDQARRFAEGLAAGGAEIANEVVLDQVLVGFGDDIRTDEVIARVQADGTCWLGGTSWRGRRLMRISLVNASTTDADVGRSVEAILRVAADV